LIDLDLSESTFKRHEVCIKDLLKYFNGDISHLTKEDIRSYLKSKKENEAKSTYANRIKALRRFFRDFLEAKKLIEGFKLPQPNSNNNNKIPSKEDLQEFYSHIEGKKYRAAFLFLASSGLRTSEVTNLKVSNVDFDSRMVIPDHNSSTKRTYVTFYNSETEEVLTKFLPEREEGDEKVFQITKRPLQKEFCEASEKSGIKITPKMLRKWFAKEMRNLNVSGEHIDAFCGRLPKTVRAQHYTDFSPERLKEVYEEANIKILEE